ncbi:DUF3846 domain-containing protein [Microbacterium aurum]
MITGLLIPANAAAPIQELTFTGADDYRTVIGDWTNDVWLKRLGVTIHVDLNGIAKRLPLNIRASRLMWSDRPDLIDTVKLYGDAVLVGDDGSRDETDVPETVRRALTELGDYAVLLKVAGRPWECRSDGHEEYLDAVTTGLVLMQCWPSAEDMRVLPARKARQLLSSQRT